MPQRILVWGQDYVWQFVCLYIIIKPNYTEKLNIKKQKPVDYSRHSDHVPNNVLIFLKGNEETFLRVMLRMLYF